MSKKRTGALGVAVGVAALVAAGAAAWITTTPPTYHVVGQPHVFGPVPEALQRADVGDRIKTHGQRIATNVPGHDETYPIPGTSKLLVSARDEWIWEVDTATGKAQRLVESPVSPTGAHAVPGHPEQVYFCMARLDYQQYSHVPGLYRLDLGTRQFTPVVTRVPVTGTLRDDFLEVPNGAPGQVQVYTQPLKEAALSSLHGEGSRQLQFCNDLDVSEDGRYVFITEPFSNPKASSGLGAYSDGITMARNGRVWRYDTQTQRVGLMIENAIFADGILIEYDEQKQVSGLLISETVGFQLGRAHFTGTRAGQYDVLWNNLPGLPDGMDRDSEGRIWVALIKERTALMNWVHRNPWIKPLLLRIPAQHLPPAKRTAVMALSPDASQVLAYSEHDGSQVLDISVPVPVGDRLYLPSFFKDNVGVHSVPLDALLSPAGKLAVTPASPAPTPQP